MGYLDGFLVTIRQHKLFGGKRVTTEYSGGRSARKKGRATDPDVEHDTEDRQARAAARASRPQPLRGRHGEVHRMRAVRGRVPGQVHLRARRRQRSRATRPRRASGSASSTRSTTCAASTATCASRRARPRRSPSRSCSSSRSPTARTRSTPRPSSSSTTSGKPQQMPWEDWRDGEDANTSGWMRATSPIGDATFRGVVGWSGERGYGVRAPEARDRTRADQ